jgi:hypothetical protein
MKRSIFLVLFCSPAFVFAQAVKSSQSVPQDLSITGEPPMLGIYWARGLEPYTRVREANKRASRKSPLMIYHGGKILPAAVTQSIFWGTSWASYTGDKRHCTPPLRQNP